MRTDSAILTRPLSQEDLQNWEKFLRDCEDIKGQVYNLITIQQTLYHTFESHIGVEKFKNSYAGHAYVAIQIALMDSLVLRVCRLWDKGTDTHSLIRCRKALQNPTIQRMVRRRAAWNYLYKFREGIDKGDSAIARYWFGRMKSEAYMARRKTMKWLKSVKNSEKSIILKSLNHYRTDKLAHRLDEISRKASKERVVEFKNDDVISISFGSIMLADDLMKIALHTGCAYGDALRISRKNARIFWDNLPEYAPFK